MNATLALGTKVRLNPEDELYNVEEYAAIRDEEGVVVEVPEGRTSGLWNFVQFPTAAEGVRHGLWLLTDEELVQAVAA